MGIEKVIKELIKKNIIHAEPEVSEQLKGGTVSELYLLQADGVKYVVKFNEPEVTKEEAFFLEFYKKSGLLPQLLFVEPEYKYIVYEYINGKVHAGGENKKEMLKVLAEELLNTYKPSPYEAGWGWPDQPADSWQSFQMDEISEAEKIIGSRLEDGEFHFVRDLVLNMREDRQRFLLHGDCGVHNFIFNNEELYGVIDPTPVTGDPLYDLVYAFCSSPDDLTKKTIDAGVRHLVVNEGRDLEDLYEQVVIGLYLRLGICVKHHPDDFDDYLRAWNYWKLVVSESRG